MTDNLLIRGVIDQISAVFASPDRLSSQSAGRRTSLCRSGTTHPQLIAAAGSLITYATQPDFYRMTVVTLTEFVTQSVIGVSATQDGVQALIYVTRLLTMVIRAAPAESVDSLSTDDVLRIIAVLHRLRRLAARAPALLPATSSCMMALTQFKGPFATALTLITTPLRAIPSGPEAPPSLALAEVAALTAPPDSRLLSTIHDNLMLARSINVRGGHFPTLIELYARMVPFTTRLAPLAAAPGTPPLCAAVCSAWTESASQWIEVDRKVFSEVVLHGGKVPVQMLLPDDEPFAGTGREAHAIITGPRQSLFTALFSMAHSIIVGPLGKVPGAQWLRTGHYAPPARLRKGSELQPQFYATAARSLVVDSVVTVYRAVAMAALLCPGTGAAMRRARSPLIERDTAADPFIMKGIAPDASTSDADAARLRWFINHVRAVLGAYSRLQTTVRQEACTECPLFRAAAEVITIFTRASASVLISVSPDDGLAPAPALCDDIFAETTFRNPCPLEMPAVTSDVLDILERCGSVEAERACCAATVTDLLAALGVCAPAHAVDAIANIMTDSSNHASWFVSATAAAVHLTASRYGTALVYAAPVPGTPSPVRPPAFTIRDMQISVGVRAVPPAGPDHAIAVRNQTAVRPYVGARLVHMWASVETLMSMGVAGAAAGQAPAALVEQLVTLVSVVCADPFMVFVMPPQGLPVDYIEGAPSCVPATATPEITMERTQSIRHTLHTITRMLAFVVEAPSVVDSFTPRRFSFAPGAVSPQLVANVHGDITGYIDAIATDHLVSTPPTSLTTDYPLPAPPGTLSALTCGSAVDTALGIAALLRWSLYPVVASTCWLPSPDSRPVTSARPSAAGHVRGLTNVLGEVATRRSTSTMPSLQAMSAGLYASVVATTLELLAQTLTSAAMPGMDAIFIEIVLGLMADLLGDIRAMALHLPLEPCTQTDCRSDLVTKELLAAVMRAEAVALIVLVHGHVVELRRPIAALLVAVNELNEVLETSHPGSNNNFEQYQAIVDQLLSYDPLDDTSFGGDNPGNAGAQITTILSTLTTSTTSASTTDNDGVAGGDHGSTSVREWCLMHALSDIMRTLSPTPALRHVWSCLYSRIYPSVQSLLTETTADTGNTTNTTTETTCEAVTAFIRVALVLASVAHAAPAEELGVGVGADGNAVETGFLCRMVLVHLVSPVEAERLATRTIISNFLNCTDSHVFGQLVDTISLRCDRCVNPTGEFALSRANSLFMGEIIAVFRGIFDQIALCSSMVGIDVRAVPPVVTNIIGFVARCPCNIADNSGLVIRRQTANLVSAFVVLCAERLGAPIPSRWRARWLAALADWTAATSAILTSTVPSMPVDEYMRLVLVEGLHNMPEVASALPPLVCSAATCLIDAAACVEAAIEAAAALLRHFELIPQGSINVLRLAQSTDDTAAAAVAPATAADARRTVAEGYALMNRLLGTFNYCLQILPPTSIVVQASAEQCGLSPAHRLLVGSPVGRSVAMDALTEIIAANPLSAIPAFVRSVNSSDTSDNSSAGRSLASAGRSAAAAHMAVLARALSSSVLASSSADTIVSPTFTGHGQLRALLMHPPFDVVAGLLAVTDSAVLQPTCRSLVAAVGHRAAVGISRRLLRDELTSPGVYLGSVLRANTPATIMTSETISAIAKPWLHALLTPLVPVIAGEFTSPAVAADARLATLAAAELELDPRQRSPRDNTSVETAAAAVGQCVDMILERIEVSFGISSSNSPFPPPPPPPPHMLHLISYAATLVTQRFPMAPPESVGAVSAGMLFLRLLCPCLYAFRSYGICTDVEDTPRVRRRMLLVSKTLQTLANGGAGAVGGKEQWMNTCKTWMAGLTPRMLRLLTTAALPTPGPDDIDTPPAPETWYTRTEHPVANDNDNNGDGEGDCDGACDTAATEPAETAAITALAPVVEVLREAQELLTRAVTRSTRSDYLPVDAPDRDPVLLMALLDRALAQAEIEAPAAVARQTTLAAAKQITMSSDLRAYIRDTASATTPTVHAREIVRLVPDGLSPMRVSTEGVLLERAGRRAVTEGDQGPIILWTIRENQPGIGNELLVAMIRVLQRIWQRTWRIVIDCTMSRADNHMGTSWHSKLLNLLPREAVNNCAAIHVLHPSPAVYDEISKLKYTADAFGNRIICHDSLESLQSVFRFANTFLANSTLEIARNFAQASDHDNVGARDASQHVFRNLQIHIPGIISKDIPCTLTVASQCVRVSTANSKAGWQETEFIPAASVLGIRIHNLRGRRAAAAAADDDDRVTGAILNLRTDATFTRATASDNHLELVLTGPDREVSALISLVQTMAAARGAVGRNVVAADRDGTDVTTLLETSTKIRIAAQLVTLALANVFSADAAVRALALDLLLQTGVRFGLRNTALLAWQSGAKQNGSELSALLGPLADVMCGESLALSLAAATSFIRRAALACAADTPSSDAAYFFSETLHAHRMSQHSESRSAALLQAAWPWLDLAATRAAAESATEHDKNTFQTYVFDLFEHTMTLSGFQQRFCVDKLWCPLILAHPRLAHNLLTMLFSELLSIGDRSMDNLAIPHPAGYSAEVVGIVATSLITSSPAFAVAARAWATVAPFVILRRSLASRSQSETSHDDMHLVLCLRVLADVAAEAPLEHVPVAHIMAITILCAGRANCTQATDIVASMANCVLRKATAVSRGADPQAVLAASRAVPAGMWDGAPAPVAAGAAAVAQFARSVVDFAYAPEAAAELVAEIGSILTWAAISDKMLPSSVQEKVPQEMVPVIEQLTETTATRSAHSEVAERATAALGSFISDEYSAIIEFTQRFSRSAATIFRNNSSSAGLLCCLARAAPALPAPAAAAAAVLALSVMVTCPVGLMHDALACFDASISPIMFSSTSAPVLARATGLNFDDHPGLSLAALAFSATADCPEVKNTLLSTLLWAAQTNPRLAHGALVYALVHAPAEMLSAFADAVAPEIAASASQSSRLWQHLATYLTSDNALSTTELQIVVALCARSLADAASSPPTRLRACKLVAALAYTPGVGSMLDIVLSVLKSTGLGRGRTPLDAKLSAQVLELSTIVTSLRGAAASADSAEGATLDNLLAETLTGREAVTSFRGDARAAVAGAEIAAAGMSGLLVFGKPAPETTIRLLRGTAAALIVALGGEVQPDGPLELAQIAHERLMSEAVRSSQPVSVEVTPMLPQRPPMPEPPLALITALAKTCVDN